MGDLQTIISAWENRRVGDEPFAVATVVRAEGSTYRRPGARMLVYGDRRRIGSVSGGCLEADVVEHALRVIETGQPKYVLYDTSGSGDAIFELGCPGTIGILIERADQPEPTSAFRLLARCGADRKPAILATVYGVVGSINTSVGARLIYSDGVVETSIADRGVVVAIMGYVCESVGSSRPHRVSIDRGGDVLEALIEPIEPPIALLICGAGQDAIPLAECASRIGWQVTVADHRAALLTPERFPTAYKLIETWSDDIIHAAPVDDRTVAVVMSHNYQHDRALVRELLTSPVRYLGMLGPRRRADRILGELREEGVPLLARDLERLHAPAGLDIGSETPDEIALAIVAEIQAVLNGRQGRPLRDHKGPIHSLPEHGAVAVTAGAY